MLLSELALRWMSRHVMLCRSPRNESLERRPAGRRENRTVLWEAPSSLLSLGLSQCGTRSQRLGRAQPRPSPPRLGLQLTSTALARLGVLNVTPATAPAGLTAPRSQ